MVEHLDSRRKYEKKYFSLIEMLLEISWKKLASVLLLLLLPVRPLPAPALGGGGSRDFSPHSPLSIKAGLVPVQQNGLVSGGSGIIFECVFN